MAEQAEGPGKVAKVTVNLPWRVWEAWAAMAAEAGLSKTETLRRAISTEVFRRDVERAGDRFLVVRPDGSVERVSFGY